MGKLIDADKLKKQIMDIYVLEDGRRSGKTYAALSGALMRSKILEIIDRQPEVKAPFKAVAEIKVDEGKLKEICKEQIKEMMKKCPVMPLQPDPEIEFDGWIPVGEKLPELHQSAGPYYQESDPVLVSCDTKPRHVLSAVCTKESDYMGMYLIQWHTYPSYDDLNNEKVLAWRPCPEPYKGNENEGY